MTIEFVNRRGQKYYLYQGTTKTGKPKYYVSLKPGGVGVDRMPDGYEFHENPRDGVLSVRKIRPTNIFPQEREQLLAWARELSNSEFVIVEIEDDCLVVYSPGDQPAHRADLLASMFGGALGDRTSHLSWIGQNITYLPMLRFHLVDEDKRLYSAERWCFRGAIDDWIPLADGKPLETHARTYLPHLMKESFYDLM